MSELSDKERAYRIADETMDAAAISFQHSKTLGPENKSSELRQVEALHWIAAEIRALRELLGNSHS